MARPSLAASFPAVPISGRRAPCVRSHSTMRTNQKLALAPMERGRLWFSSRGSVHAVSSLLR